MEIIPAPAIKISTALMRIASLDNYASFMVYVVAICIRDHSEWSRMPRKEIIRTSIPIESRITIFLFDDHH
jgi:hypothetical protein